MHYSLFHVYPPSPVNLLFHETKRFRVFRTNSGTTEAQVCYKLEHACLWYKTKAIFISLCIERVTNNWVKSLNPKPTPVISTQIQPPWSLLPSGEMFHDEKLNYLPRRDENNIWRIQINNFKVKNNVLTIKSDGGSIILLD